MSAQPPSRNEIAGEIARGLGHEPWDDASDEYRPLDGRPISWREVCLPAADAVLALLDQR